MTWARGADGLDGLYGNHVRTQLPYIVEALKNGDRTEGNVDGTRDMKAHLILYVNDQKASTEFYSRVFGRQPDLNVPGMTEFRLNEGAVFGLMPAAGIKRLLGNRMPDPAQAAGIPRAEFYLLTEKPDEYHQRALTNGAKELSALSPRDWGHEAAYSLDPDGHVLAFARELTVSR